MEALSGRCSHGQGLFHGEDGVVFFFICISIDPVRDWPCRIGEVPHRRGLGCDHLV